jgi:hypothetical protein
MPELAILALDLGTTTGWAMFEAGRIESGSTTFSVRVGESPGMRYLAFNRWLDALVLANGLTPRVQLIAFEKPLGIFAKSGAQVELSMGLMTRIEEFCARHNLQHTAVPIGTLKKWTTGTGSADKAMMQAAVMARWNFMPKSHDEADALALLQYARATWRG